MGIGNIATTGMQAAMSNMEVISNNIANAGTYGFKRSMISFSDLYPSALGVASNQIGTGVNVASIYQDFSSGASLPTGQPLDLSINSEGNGFFVLRNPSTGQTAYSRNGHFALSAQGGYILSGNQRLQGFLAVNGQIPSGSTVSDLIIGSNTVPATASTTANTQVNLNSNSQVPTVTPFDPSNTATFNYESTVNIFDSLGNQHAVTSYYVMTSPDNWAVNVYVDGASVGAGTASFSTNGQLLGTTGLSGLSFSPTTGATSPQTFSVNMNNSTQYGNPNSVVTSTDGNRAGKFQSITIDGDGNLFTNYDNGQQVLSGQLAIATFQSPDGLIDIGNMSWVASSNSGAANINPGNSSENISAGGLEISNVDLTTEMVNLIGAQHTFQANAQVENTYNEVMQTVIKL